MTQLHSKQLGNLGEMRIAADLIAQGYYVFTELGDIAKTDLVALDANYQVIKIQVKCFNSKNGAVPIKSSKSGPNYQFKYEEKHADVYAVYVADLDEILYINNKELLKYKTITIRIEKPSNKQNKKIHWLKDYTDFKKALRGHTHDTQTDNAVGDEMVQTTTETANES